MFTPHHIRLLRKRLGDSITQFGARVGVSANTVSRWEAGDRHPRYEHLERLTAIEAKANKAESKADAK